MKLREAYRHIHDFPAPFWILLSATLMNQIGNMAIVFLVIYLNQHLNFSLSKASFAFAALSASMLLSSLLGGSIIDKFGPPHVLICTLIVNGLVMLAFPMASHYPSILLLCLVWGFVFGLSRPAAQTFLSQLSKPGLHKITFSMYRLVLNLGMSIGPALGGFLASFMFSSIFIFNGVANLLASFILIIGLYQTNLLRYQPKKRPSFGLSLKWLKQDATLRLFVLAMIPVAMIFYQHQSSLGLFLSDNLKLPLTFFGLLFTMNTLIIVFFELVLNIATMHWSYRINFMLGTIFITIGFAGLAFANSAWYVILLTLFWTLGEMILYPAASSYIADIAPESERGSYMSLYSICNNAGMLFGPWGGMLIMGYFGASALWAACAVAGLVSIVLFGYMREPDESIQ